MNKISLVFFAITFFAQYFPAQRIMPVLDADDVYPFHPMNGEVYAMHQWNGNLVVGGRFDTFNNQPFANILLWNGEHAAAIGTGFGGGNAGDRVTSLTVWDDVLVMGGRVELEDRIYTWDGETGNYLGGDLNGTVYDLEVFNNELYAIGTFEPAMQKWNGSQWQEVATDFTAEINDIKVHNGLLYACGLVGQDELGNPDLPGAVYSFDGNEWVALDMLPEVAEPRKMFSIDGELLVCGSFTNSGEQFGLAEVNGNMLDVSPLDAPPHTLSVARHGDDLWFVAKKTGSFFPVYINSVLWRNISMPHLLFQASPADITVSDNNIFIPGDDVVSFPSFSETATGGLPGLFTVEKDSRDIARLDVNNCDALTFPSASIFWNYQEGISGFHVPAGSDLSTIYATSIWAAALSGSDTLAAAGTAGFQSNAWPFGPVCNEVDLAYAWRYYQVWQARQDEIDYHLQHFADSDYITPYFIATWPGNGNFANGEAHVLAPFMDQDGDNIYEPWQGDAPEILGDEALFFILSDQRSFYEDDTWVPMNLEMHVMMYAFENETGVVDNSVFIHTTIFNRSPDNYTGFRIGIWNDWDIGNAVDDYVGCDVEQRIFYGYNAENMDEDWSGSAGYGLNPPAQGCVLLSEGLAGHTYYHITSNPVTGEPASPAHFYNFLHGMWKDGSPILDEYGNTDPHMFNGSPCGNFENEWSAGNPPGDRRAVGASESTTLNAGDYLCFDYAYVYYRDALAGNLENACTLIEVVPDVVEFWNALQAGCEVNTSIAEIENVNPDLNIWPNPAHDLLNFGASWRSNNSSVIIRDILGHVVMKYKISTPGLNTIDVSTLESGVYLMTVEGMSKTWVKE